MESDSASWDFPRSPAATRVLLSIAAEEGVSASSCLAGTGLTEGDLADPELWLEAAKLSQLVDQCIERRLLCRRAGKHQHNGAGLLAVGHSTIVSA